MLVNVSVGASVDRSVNLGAGAGARWVAGRVSNYKWPALNDAQNIATLNALTT